MPIDNEKFFLYRLYSDNKIEALRGYLKALKWPSRGYTSEEDKSLRDYVKGLIKRWEKMGNG